MAGLVGVAQRTAREPWPLVIATTVGAVASIALTGLRRAGASPESRYSDIVVLLALPALALLTQEAGRWLIRRLGRPALVVCSTVVVAFLVVQVVALNDDVSSEPFVGEMRPRVLATARIMRDHEPIADHNIFGIPYLTEPSTSTIARLDRNGELPALDVSTADILTAGEYVGAVIGDASRYPEGSGAHGDDRGRFVGRRRAGLPDRRTRHAGTPAGRAARAAGRRLVPGGDRSGRDRGRWPSCRATRAADRASSRPAPAAAPAWACPGRRTSS